MKNFLDTLILSIVATITYELLKKIIFTLSDIIKLRSLPFSISGYWCSYVVYKVKNEKKYSAYELIKITYKKEIAYLKMYQITEDGRTSCYKGYGFLRGDKLAFAYSEAKKSTSNKVGTIILRYRNIIEHQVFLFGNYHEFRYNNFHSNSYPYRLKQYEINFFKSILCVILGEKYIFSLMKKERFKSECKKMQ